MAEMQVLRLRPPVGLVDFAQDDNFVGVVGNEFGRLLAANETPPFR